MCMGEVGIAIKTITAGRRVSRLRYPGMRFDTSPKTSLYGSAPRLRLAAYESNAKIKLSKIVITVASDGKKITTIMRLSGKNRKSERVVDRNDNGPFT